MRAKPFDIDRLIKRTTAVLMVLLFAMALLFWEFLSNATPWQRDDPEIPLFTVADSSLSQYVANGQHPVRFGPLFWGLIEGAPAFSSTVEARYWLGEHPKKNWRVYELAGDYRLDAGNGRTLRTLVVIGPVS